MNVLVTGSSGFIGPYLVEALIERGHYVIGIDRVAPSAIEPHVFVQGDLTDGESVDKALAHDVDLVAHLAAARADWGLTDQEYIRDNVTATRDLIETAAKEGVTRWMFYSSVGVFGPSEVPLDDSAPRAPVGVYGETKAESEALFDTLAASDHEMQVAVIRPSAVFGPGNPENTNVYRLIDAIYRRRFVMIGDGSNTKTVSYLPNLIDATMFLLERMSPGVDKYIYVDSPALTTRELVEQIYDALGKSAPRWNLPLPLARSLAYPADFTARVTGIDLPITSARIQKFCRSTYFDRTALDRTGFRPAVSPAEAIRATVDWYLQTHETA